MAGDAVPIPAKPLARYIAYVVPVRAILASILAAPAGAAGGHLLTGGSIHNLGPAIFALYFTLLGSLGLLAPAYALMKVAQVSLLRRYIGVFALGTFAGALILLPMDLAAGHLNAAPLGAWFGGITGAFWVLFHSAARMMRRGSGPAN